MVPHKISVLPKASLVLIDWEPKTFSVPRHHTDWVVHIIHSSMVGNWLGMLLAWTQFVLRTYVDRPRRTNDYRTVCNVYQFGRFRIRLPRCLGGWSKEAQTFDFELGKRMSSCTGEPRSFSFFRQLVSLAILRVSLARSHLDLLWMKFITSGDL